MRMRASVAALLAMIVIGMSTWAAACDLLCSLDRARPACHPHDGAAADSPAMAAMPGMDTGKMAMPDGPAASVGSPLVVARVAGSCGNPLCSLTALRVAKRGGERFPLAVVGVIAPPTVPVGSNVVLARSAAETPPRAFEPIDPLGTTLRI